MGYHNTAKAINKAKELALENKKLQERIDNLIDSMKQQKAIYMNVVKAMVLQCGKEEGDEYILNIPLDVTFMENWELESIPDEQNDSLIMHLKEK